MGCEVNGPGEAKDADVGIAAGAGRAIIFRKGQKVRVVEEKDMLTALMEEVGKAEAINQETARPIRSLVVSITRTAAMSARTMSSPT